MQVKVNTRAALALKPADKPDETGLTAITRGGTATLEEIEPGEYMLEIMARGYVTQKKVVIIDADDETNQDTIEVVLETEPPATPVVPSPAPSPRQVSSPAPGRS